jgi:hypothetical protein
MGAALVAGANLPRPPKAPIGEPLSTTQEAIPELKGEAISNGRHATSIPKCTCGMPLWHASVALQIPQYRGGWKAKPIALLTGLERGVLEGILDQALHGVGEHSRVHEESAGPGAVALQRRHPMTLAEAEPLALIRATRRAGLVLPGGA